ncbi:MAG: hypothetical protein K6F69_10715 [Treponema sp.]|nr:hypothetical protein [Treponema sp.]
METLLALLEFFNTYDHKDIFFKLSECILSNVKELENMTIETLAERADVSVSTVNRFVRMMAFRDFSSIKYISESISNAYEYEGQYIPLGLESFEKGSFKLYGKLLCNKINEVINSISEQDVESYVEKLLNADKVVFIGSPIPYNVWRLQVPLVVAGIKTSAFLDPNYQQEEIKQLTDKSVVTALQVIRPSNDYLYQMLSESQKRGAKTCLITNVLSGGNKKADYSFVFNGTFTEIDMHIVQVILSMIGLVLNEKLKDSWR